MSHLDAKTSQFVCSSSSLLVCLCACMSICLSTLCLIVRLCASTCISTCLCVHLFGYLSVQLFVYLIVYMYIHLFACIPVCLFGCLPSSCQSLCSTCLSICLSSCTLPSHFAWKHSHFSALQSLGENDGSNSSGSQRSVKFQKENRRLGKSEGSRGQYEHREEVDDQTIVVGNRLLYSCFLFVACQRRGDLPLRECC